MDEMRECPQCAEPVKATAMICRHCRSRLPFSQEGQLVRVRVRGRERTYWGDLFVAARSRVSDTINDERHFVVLTNAMEETKTADVRVGFLAINKNSIEWVRLVEAPEKGVSRTLDE